MESKITPRFLAEATGLMEVFEGIDEVGLSLLASCVGRPMNINSVLEELREEEGIPDSRNYGVLCELNVLWKVAWRRKRKAEYHLHKVCD